MLRRLRLRQKLSRPAQLPQDWLVAQLLLFTEQPQPTDELQRSNPLVEEQLWVGRPPQLLVVQHVDARPHKLP